MKYLIVASSSFFFPLFFLCKKKMATPATQFPRALNCYTRLVITERGRCFLTDYVKHSAAQPSLICCNTIRFVAQLRTLWWATTNLNNLQLCFHHFLSALLKIQHEREIEKLNQPPPTKKLRSFFIFLLIGAFIILHFQIFYYDWETEMHFLMNERRYLHVSTGFPVLWI